MSLKKGKNRINLIEFIIILCRSGSPIPIEYLPAENTLSSRVRLLILYQGRPTTTIAVGDPLTFRLEAQDGYVIFIFLLISICFKKMKCNFLIIFFIDTIM